MRLLLDEHYANDIAKGTRAHGHDVVAVTERTELIALPDAELFSRMVEERRAIVTENAGDFMPLFQAAAAGGEDHYGLIFTSPARMPRSKETIGLYVRVLAEFLSARLAEDALLNQTYWLP